MAKCKKRYTVKISNCPGLLAGKPITECTNSFEEARQIRQEEQFENGCRVSITGGKRRVRRRVRNGVKARLVSGKVRKHRSTKRSCKNGRTRRGTCRKARRRSRRTTR